MARFRYRYSRSSGRFPVGVSERTQSVVPSPPSSAAPSSFAPRLPQDRHHAPPQHPRHHRRSRRTGLGVVTPQTTDAWRALLTPDGTPPALPYQIDYVRTAVWQQTGLRPSLRGLTIGQAERILAALRVDPRPLWLSGRDNWVMNVLAICGKWLAFAALFMLILGVGRADGVPFVLLILAAMGLSVARRQRRQLFEERHYRRALDAGRQPSAGMLTAHPDAPDGEPAPEQHGSPPTGGDPYDVDTYLRRLGEEGR